MFSGSSARLMARIMSTAPIPVSSTRKPCLCRPMLWATSKPYCATAYSWMLSIVMATLPWCWPAKNGAVLHAQWLFPRHHCKRVQTATQSTCSENGAPWSPLGRHQQRAQHPLSPGPYCCPAQDAGEGGARCCCRKTRPQGNLAAKQLKTHLTLWAPLAKGRARVHVEGQTWSF